MKSEEHIELMRIAGRICADTLNYLFLLCKPGISGLQLDKAAEDYIRSFGATPSCLNYKGFPSSCCISINAGVVHCIPNNKLIQEGDVAKLDLVVNYKGWNADSAITVLVPPVKPEVRKLAETTYNAMLKGIEQAKEGNKVLDISKAIYDARNACGVIAEFCGHGIGREIHERPKISNIPIKDQGDSLLVAGMTLCLEPIFCLGDPAIFHDPKQWDTFILSGQSVSHWEHTILVNPTPLPPTILTLRNNENIP